MIKKDLSALLSPASLSNEDEKQLEKKCLHGSRTKNEVYCLKTNGLV